MEKTTEHSVTHPEADAMLNKGAEDNQASKSSSIKESETIDLTFLDDPLNVMDQQISIMQTIQ